MSSLLDRLLGPWRRLGGGVGGDAAPDAARFADEPVRRLVAGAAEGWPVLGLGAGGEPVTVALGGGEATVAVVGGTDDEAAAILRPLLAQAVRQGARATILEPARPSQRWAAGVPGVVHLAGPSVVHTGLVELAGALGRRPADGDDAGRRHVVVADDTALVAELELRWRRNRSSGAAVASPAIAALDDLVVRGGAARINVLLRPVVRYGPPRRREALERLCPVMVRADPVLWAWAAPEVRRVPRKIWRSGRVHVVCAGRAVETQVLAMTEDEARAWAAAGPGDSGR